MSVVLIGLDHRATPSELLDRVAVGADGLPEVLDRLAKSEHIAEAVVVSTCLRTEVYVDAVRFHGAVHDVRAMLSEYSGVPLETLTGFVFEFNGETAFAHLFRVACGLESSVTGEPEVLGQVSRSWAAARDRRNSKAVLNGLFRHAIEVGKRARTDTAIARGATSIGSATVEMVKQNIGSLANKHVLVIGAGEMADSMAVALTDAKNDVVVDVTNRTHERAVALAARVNGNAKPFTEIPQLLADADIVLSSTGSKEPIITEEMARSALSIRESKPIVVVDVAVPPDVDAQVRSLEGVTVLDMTDLSAFANAGRSDRAAEIETVEAFISEEVWRYTQDVNARTVVPVLAALREKVELVRDLELQRQGKRLSDLDPTTAATVESIINAVTAKLLHEPTVRLKSVAGTPEGERMAEAIRYLFDV